MSNNAQPATLEVYYGLESEAQRIHRKWNEFKRLYLTDTQTVELLNFAAQGFFVVLRQDWLDDILLVIARLTDGDRRGKFDNLSLHRLAKMAKDPNIQVEVNKLTKQADYARKHRNQRIAHADLSTYLGTNLQRPLEDVFREPIETSLNLISDILNSVRIELNLEGDFGFQHSSMLYGANELVIMLRAAKKLADADMERLSQGLPRLLD